MRTFTIVFGFCVGLTTIFGAPNSVSVEQTEWGMLRKSLSIAKQSHGTIQSIISLRYLSTLETRDSFADLIENELGKTPTQFLQDLNTLFRSVDRVMKEGVLELDRAAQLDELIINRQILEIKTRFFNEALGVAQKFITDLARVLIGFPTGMVDGNVRYDPIADLIRAILCKTLQQFVEAIKNALEQSLGIVDNASQALLSLSNEARPQVAAILREISNKQLYVAKQLIINDLNVLRNLLDFRRDMISKYGDVDALNITEDKDLFDAIVLSVFGFSAQTAANQAQIALSEMIPLVDSSRDELIETLSHIDNAEVQTKVVRLYDSAMDSFIEDVRPVFMTLVDLQGTGCNNTYVFDLMGSLPAIGMDYFQTYLQHQLAQIHESMKLAYEKMETTASEGGADAMARVSEWSKRHVQALESIFEPLLETLGPILEKPQIEAGIKVGESQGKQEWLEQDGKLYNRDALISAVSKELGFDTKIASKALKTSLEKLDDVMELTLFQLDDILGRHDVFIHDEIVTILNKTLINIHIASQPMLNVLLPFIPDGFRSNKHVALDIYSGISGVNVEEFIAYCKAAARNTIRLMSEATSSIKAVADEASPEAGEEIRVLLESVEGLTKIHLRPFLESIHPIISPSPIV